MVKVYLRMIHEEKHRLVLKGRHRVFHKVLYLHRLQMRRKHAAWRRENGCGRGAIWIEK